ncbi:MAG TPA: phytase [bacterium]
MLKHFIQFTFFISLIFLTTNIQTSHSQTITSQLTLNSPGTVDQDDMCIWIHPTDPSQSTIITSDKEAKKLFVYDLKSDTVQVVSVVGKPGNIDVRYNFPFQGKSVDIVAFCDRANSSIVVYKVDGTTRLLSLINSFDAGDWPVEIYGFCLYHSPSNGKFYAIACGKSSQMKQWELVDNGDETIRGIEKRTWKNGNGGLTEGLVADDETGKLYAANEDEGIYKYEANPIEANPSGELIAPVGQGGLEADVEGVSIYYATDGEGYIIASSQGNDKFIIFERKPPHRPVGEFPITDVRSTDGIDITNLSLGTVFSQGIFTCHNGEQNPCPVEVIKWDDIAKSVGGLIIDSQYWNPRHGSTSVHEGKLEGAAFPDNFQLYQNYPNPFNMTAKIRYDLANSDHVAFHVFNLQGQLVSTLFEGFHNSGTYTIEWSVLNQEIPCGIYLYQIQTNSSSKARTMTLIK